MGIRGGRSQRWRLAFVAGALVLAATLFGAGSDASANLRFCPTGSGAGQCKAQEGIAVDFETGHLYVADKGNNRIDVFNADGEFLFAFGWGVDTGAEELESCTTASGCQQGLAGSGTAAGAGQFTSPRLIAVDNDSASSSHHDIYVAERANHRVQKFDPEGNFLLAFGKGVNTGTSGNPNVCTKEGPPTDVCGLGSAGFGAGQFETIEGIGVASSGAVYVADVKEIGSCKVPGVFGEEFTKRVQVFNESGNPSKEVSLTDAPCEHVRGFAVDSSGDFYLANSGLDAAIRKYDLSPSLLCEKDKGAENKGTETTNLAVDSDDDLFAAQREVMVREVGSPWRLLTKYGPSCNRLRRFGYGEIERPVQGIAPFQSKEVGDVFASEEEEGIDYLLLPPKEGSIIVPPSVKADPSNTKATLGAEVNPEGKKTSFRFEYVDEATYQKDIGELGEGHGFDEAQKTEIPIAADPEDPEEFRLHAAETLVGCADPTEEPPPTNCLFPETTYRFRIFAKNPDGEGNGPIEGKPFTTNPSLLIGPTWSTQVGVDTAQLHAEANPLGIHATGYFQYVDDATYQKDVKELGEGHGFDHAKKAPDVDPPAEEAPIDYGEGEELTERSTTVFPLAPRTTYHYRLLATDPVLAEPIAGEERTLKTFAVAPIEECPANKAFRTGASAPLPDCRAYEMVSPLDKENGDIVVLHEILTDLPTVLNQSSVAGSRLAYGTYRAFGNAKSASYTTQYVAARKTDGWQSHSVSPPRGRDFYPGITSSFDTELKAFSPDLCQAWVRTISDPPLASGAIAGYPNLYRRQDEECGGLKYEALTNAAPQNLASNDERYLELELQGLSANGDRAIYVAHDSLEESGAPNLGGVGPQLYLRVSGSTPVFVCVLPSGEALSKPCSAGRNDFNGSGKNRSANVQGAISADGQRVFWTDSGSGPGKIYMREHAEQGQVAGECEEAGKPCTIAVSKAAEELSGTSTAQFFAAARDGSRAIFTSGKDLYEFDVGSKATRLIAHEALLGSNGGLDSGPLGVSEDASHVYFASTEALPLSGENSEGKVAEAGKPNLYLDHEGALSFIATLSERDLPDPLLSSSLLSPISREPRFHLARVSPDGEHAAFMSSAPLTGYDNTDAKSGEADTEVFLYDAAADKLVCASCNPSGARPAGALTPESHHELWAAAHIPVYETTLYAARVLSDDGRRLFFESSDALVARDTNARQDVYQWEALGKGGCDKGDVSFSTQDEGCIDLISSGQSARDSQFVDASPSGSDVFFTTLSSLLPQDFDLVDIYDARAGGGFPPPPPLPEECEGEACQSPPAPEGAPTPASGVLGTPDQTLPPEPSCPKGRHLAKRKGKTHCVPNSHSKGKQKQKRHSRRGRGR